MKPHDEKNTPKPTRMVGGAGHWNRRGAKTHKSKEKK